MNNSVKYDVLQCDLTRLKVRVPDLPVEAVLLSRLLLDLGRGVAALLLEEIRPSGLTEAEFRVLTMLLSQPDGAAHPGELGSTTSQSPANMSRISDALVARGLIDRLSSAHDRRKMILRITLQGEALVQRLLPQLSTHLVAMFKELSVGEQTLLTSQLKRLDIRLNDTVAGHAPEKSA